MVPVPDTRKVPGVCQLSLLSSRRAYNRRAVLAREKRRAGVSLVIGLAAGSIIVGVQYLGIVRAERRLRDLEEKCVRESKAVPIPPGATVDQPPPGVTLEPLPKSAAKLTPKEVPPRPYRILPKDFIPDVPLTDWDFVCSGAALSGVSDEQLHSGRGRELRDAYRSLSDQRDQLGFLFLPAGVLLVFLLPLVWYFLLDRLTEISAAISGRDRK